MAGAGWAAALAVLCASAPATAQDFAAPRMVDEDERQPRPGNEPADDGAESERGAEDDGTVYEIGPDGRRRRAPPDALRSADPGRAPRRPTDAPRPTDQDPPPPEPPAPPPPSTASSSGPPPESSAPPDAGVAPQQVPAPPPAPPPSPLGSPSLGVAARAQEGVLVARHTHAELIKAWDIRRLEAIRDPAAGQKALLGVLGLFRALGGGAPEGAQDPELALALVGEAHAVLDRLEADRGVLLAEAASSIAPSLPATHLARARAYKLRNAGDLGAILGAVADAVKAEFADVPARVHWALALSTAILLTLLALLGAATLLMGGRKLALWVHDLGHLLPASMRGLLPWAVAAVLALLPLLLALGPLPLVLWWLVLTWRYLDAPERGVAVVCGVATLLIPLALKGMAPMLIFANTPQAEALRGLDELSMRTATIEALKGASDPLLRGVRGTLLKRAGLLDEARTEFEAALRSNPQDGWLHNNLGCVQTAEGDLERALLSFERAAEAEPTQALYLHNAANIQSVLGKAPAAKVAWDAAEAAQPGMAQGFRDRSAGPAPRPHNVVVLDARPPMMPILLSAFTPSAASDAVADDAWALLCPVLPRSLYPALVAGLALLAGLLMLLQRKRHPPQSCRKCGAPACRACDGNDTDGLHCGPCYNAFMVRGAKVEAALKIRKDVQVRRYRTRRAWIIRGLSALWGGGGLYLAGRPLVATGLVAVFSLGALLAATGGFWVPDARGLGVGVTWLRVGMFALPALVAWAVGLWMSFRTEA